MRRFLAVPLLATLFLGTASAAPAAGEAVQTAAPTVPAGFTDSLVATLPAPTAVAFTPDGRMVAMTQQGTVRIGTAAGTLLATPALDLGAKVCANGERGLLGVATAPPSATNNSISLYYTANNPASCEIFTPNAPFNGGSRFPLPASNVISPASELVLLDNIQS